MSFEKVAPKFRAAVSKLTLTLTPNELLTFLVVLSLFMKKKIVIAGGTGFIGNYLKLQFKSDGYEVLIISRDGEISWSNRSEMISALEGAEMVINLAGKSVNCRYNELNKGLIMSSRIRTTKALGEAIQSCINPPGLWLNASTATIYRDEKARPNTEADGATGEGFSVEVSKQWEHAFYSFKMDRTRQVALRISLVLGNGGGVFPVYKNLVRYGLGGRQGDGKQMFSWIHIHDFFRLICFVRDHENIVGPVNCASPEPLSNAQLMKEFREAMHMKFGLPGPKWMLEMGAVLIGTEPELIFKSRWVIPKKLTDAGFSFQFPTAKSALNDLLHPVT